MSVNPLIYLQPKDVSRFVLENETPTRIIVPGPGEADRVRDHFSREFFEKNIDPETMSSFVKKGLRAIDKNLKVIRKSVLLRELSSVWAEKYENKDDLFFQCFKYLTEFRGYTLDANLFQEIKESINQEIFEGVFFLWSYMDAANIIDEQKGYSIMAKSPELFSESDYLFWGFSNINSMQIDLLNEIARFSNVYLPIHAYAANKLKKSDWPLWLLQEEEISLALTEKEDLEKIIVKDTQAEISFFNKNRLGERLASLDIDSETTFILPGADKSFWLNNEYEGGNFKFFESLSSQEVELSGLLKDLSFLENNVDLRAFLVNKLKTCFDEKNKNFKKIKVYSAAINYIDKWEESVGFDFKNSSVQKKALLESLILDSPRLNLVVSFVDNEADRDNTIYDKDLILSGDIKDNLCVIYKKDFTPLKRGEVGHSSEVQSFLATLGPLLNNDFEFESITSQLKYYIEKSSKSNLLFEGDVLEGDIDLKDFVSEFDLKNRKGKLISPKKPGGDEVSVGDFHRPISPSSLQKYIDCPRSYFLHYGEKRRDTLEMKETFLARFKGTLEHNVVENYITDYDEFCSDKLETFSKEIIARELVQKGIDLDVVSLRNLELEIMKFSESGIKFIYNIKASLPNWAISIEKEIKSKEFYGTADLVIESDEYFGIIDLKRSSFGIPAKKSVLDFSDIQIPSYVGNYSRISSKKLAFFGYFCLKEPEKSLIISSEEFFDELKSCGGFRTQKMTRDEVSDFIERELEYEVSLINRIKEDQEFDILPSSNDACSFCHFQLVCPRGAL